MRILRKPTFWLIALIGLLHLPLVFAPDEFFMNWYTTDDAFYYFKVAQNVMDGQGFTFDGIARGNGFHPLWMFVILPVFALPGKILPLRVLLVLLTLLSIGMASFLHRLLKTRVHPALAFLGALAFALLPQTHRITMTSGLEAGLSAFFIVLLLYLLAEHPKRTGTLSLVAAAALFARLDNVFLVLLSGIWWSWRHGLWSRERVRTWIKAMFRYYAPMTIFMVAYFAWNWFGFETLMPISGQIKRWWGTLPNTPYGFPVNSVVNFFGQTLTDDPNIGPFSLITAPAYRAAEWLAATIFGTNSVGARRFGVVALGGSFGIVALWLSVNQRKWLWETVNALGVPLLAAGCLMQIVYYKAGGTVAQRFWYWHSEMLLIIVLGVVLLEALRLLLVPKLSRGEHPARVGASVALAATVLGLVSPHVSRLSRAWVPRETQPFYAARAAWLESYTEPGAKIGMTGTGSSAYFTDNRTLVNVDGLISSKAYFEQLKAGTAAQYFDEIGLDYVFGNDYIMLVSDPYGDIFADRVEPIAIFEERGETNIVLWRYMRDN